MTCSKKHIIICFMIFCYLLGSLPGCNREAPAEKKQSAADISSPAIRNETELVEKNQHNKQNTETLPAANETKAPRADDLDPRYREDTKVTHGPYLFEMTDTSVSIMWFTDNDCAASVEYGTGGNFQCREVDAQRGQYEVGKQHIVRLTNLEPGTTYEYRIVSQRVMKLKSVEHVLGETLVGPTDTFTTFTRNKNETTFYYLTDLHNNTNRINLLYGRIDYSDCDFIVNGGDNLEPNFEGDVFQYIVDPITGLFAKSIPYIHVRGNHEMRGLMSRQFYNYFPYSTGGFYYAFRQGPAGFMVIDTGEDKPDNHYHYSGLAYSVTYRKEELNWLKDYAQKNEWNDAPFRIFLQHIPDFGNDIDRSEWNRFAKDAGVDLILSGHRHNFHYTPPEMSPGGGHLYTIGQDELAKVRVTQKYIVIIVYDLLGKVKYSNLIFGDRNTAGPAANAKISASSSVEADNWSSRHINDGQKSSVDSSKGWSSNGQKEAGHEEWIMVDLGKEQNISLINLYPTNYKGNVGECFPEDFNIQISSDNKNWITVTDIKGYKTPEDKAQAFPIPSQPARYIKVTGTKLRPSAADGLFRMQLAEIEVF